MIMYTPWGITTLNENILDEKIWTFSLKDEEGMRICLKYAHGFLSVACIRRGVESKRWLFFKDSLAPLYEMPWISKQIFSALSIAEIQQMLINRLSSRCPEYLLEIGISVKSDAFQKYLIKQEINTLLFQKSDNLIVAARPANNIDLLEVKTAAGNSYYVDRASYDPCKQPNLLEYCKKIQIQ